jgi:biotin carboxyl carrier protein
MTFEVETGDVRRVVEVTESHGKYRVVVDGKALEVDLAQAGDVWSLLVVPGREESRSSRDVVSARSYEVAFGTEPGAERLVYVNGRAVPVRLEGPATVERRRAGSRRDGSGRHAGDVRGGPSEVRAPMPGRIVKVLVGAGDIVSAGQGVAVVEAMKMENEVRAPRSGKVREVRVAQGTLVEARAVLVVIE